MIDKRFRVLMALCAVALCMSMHARPPVKPRGVSHAIQTRQLKTAELGEVLGRLKKPATRSAPCPLLPIDIPTVVPIQNPDAPAVAFYVNPATWQSTPTSNSTLLPPQTISATYAVNQATPGIADYVGPFNTAMCAGLEQVVFASSEALITFDRSLALDNVLNTDLVSFANTDGDFSFLNGSQEIDMRYDKFANRFFFAMDAVSFLGDEANTGVTFGCSDSGIISEDTIWTIVTINDACLVPDNNGCPGDINPSAGGVFYDYCRVGVDQHAYYFAFAVLSGYNGLFYANSAFVIQKESLLNGGPVTLTVFRDVDGTPGDATPYRVNGTSLLIPVMNFDSNSEFGYFIQQDPVYWGKLNVYRVINPGTANPTLSAVSIIDVPTTFYVSSPTTLAPFLGNQFDYLGIIDGIDDRLKMAHIRNHQLFTVHNILTDSTGVGSANGDRYALRWYQLDLTGDPTGNGNGDETVSTTPVLIQAGTLFDPSETDPIWYYQPALMTNINGDMSVSGVLSGNTQSISAFNTGRLAADPLGILRIGATPSDIIFAQGSGPYSLELASTSQLANTGPTFGQRISDRQYTCFDPANGTTMWAVQQFIRAGLLQCMIARLDAPAI